MALNDSNLYSYSVKKGKRAVSTIRNTMKIYVSLLG